MITNYFTRPQLWMPAYNPIIWSFVSDETTQPDFSYIVDVYVTAVTAPTTYSYRLVQKPNPTGNCIVDVSSIVQGFFDMSNFYGTEYGGSVTPPRFAKYGYGNDPGSEKWNAIASVYIVVGEQYSVNGVLTTFDGFGSVGNPGYDLYSDFASEPVRVLPGALPYEDSVANLMATSLANSFYAPYIMDGDGKFLTRLGPTQDIAVGQTHTLGFLNWWDGATGSYASPIRQINVDFYTGANTLISTTTYLNTVAEGGGPQTTSNYTSATFDISAAALSVRVGPADLTIPADTSYYTVQAFFKSTAPASPITVEPASEILKFNLVEYCEDLFPVVRVGWLNDLGGKDYYNFTMFYEKTTSSPDETWYQPEINWDGATPYPTTQTGSWWLRGGFKSFGKSVTTSFVLQTDFVLQETVDALGQIFESPLVWAYIGTTSTDPIALQVTGIDYTYTTVKLVKLVQVTLECQFNKIQPKQIL